MLKKFAMTASLIFYSASGPAFAGNQGGTATHVSVDNTGGPYVFLVSGPRSDQPACAQDGYWGINNISTDSAKLMVATILTAYSLGRQVYIQGTGICPEGYARESVAFVIFQ